QARRERFCELRRQLAHLRFGGDPQSDGGLRGQVLYDQNIIRRVAAGHHARNVAKRSRYNFAGIEVGSVLAARALGAELIAGLDFCNWSDSCSIKARGIRGVTAENGVFGEMD